MSKPSTNKPVASGADDSGSQLPDWGAAPGANRAGRRALVLLSLIVPGIVIAAVVGAMTEPRRGILVGIVYAIAVLSLVWGQGIRVLGSLGARRLREGEHPRFENIVRGLAQDVGIPAPALYVIPEGGPNAACFTSRGNAIAATTRLLEDYTRTEVEAVVAHCLLRFARRDVGMAMLATAAWPFGHRFAPRVGYEDDVQTAALTRFPPALAGAIQKAEPQAGRYSGLWFVATGATHRPAAERVAALESL